MQLPMVADAGVWTTTLQHLVAIILKYSAASQTDRASSLILINAITAVYRIAALNPEIVCSSLNQSQDCARVLTILSSAPLNPRLFPAATTAAAAAADDHDLAVCGRGCVLLLSRLSSAPVAMPAMQTVRGLRFTPVCFCNNNHNFLTWLHSEPSQFLEDDGAVVWK
jgi:hypothetical protein